MSNLFTHVVKCGLCGGPLHFIDKGKPPPKRGQYLVCDASRRLKTCPAKAVRYDEFERLFFENFKELDIYQLMAGKDEAQARRGELEKQVVANCQKITEAAAEVENLTDSIARTMDSRVREQLEKRLSEVFDVREHLEAGIKQAEQEITALQQQENRFEDGVELAREVYRLLDSAKGEEQRIALRLRLRQQIQKLIKWIKIYPLQEPYQEVQEAEEPGIIKVMRSRYIDRVRIKFKGSGNWRLLFLKSYGELID